MIDQAAVLLALNNLMGRRQMPSGTQDDLQRYCQEAFNFAWRYYNWNFSLKAGVPALDTTTGNYYMPADFDILGYIKPIGATMVSLDLVQGSAAGGTSFSLQFDFTKQQYQIIGATSFTFVYQVAPPTLVTGQFVPFPSAMVVAEGAAIWAKQGENPTHADVSQEWDIFRDQLDMIVGRATWNEPVPQARNLQDLAGTGTGDTGDN